MEKPAKSEFNLTDRTITELSDRISNLKNGYQTNYFDELEQDFWWKVLVSFFILVWFVFNDVIGATGFFILLPILYFSLASWLLAGFGFLLDKVQSRTIPDNVQNEINQLQSEISNRHKYNKSVETWEYNNLVVKQGYWQSKKGIELENALQKLLIGLGWETSTTSTTGDGGIDLISTKQQQKVLIQCKGHKAPLGVGAIRDAAGVKSTEKCSAMIVVAPNGFTAGSIEFAKASKVKLFDGTDLTNLAMGNIDLV